MELPESVALLALLKVSQLEQPAVTRRIQEMEHAHSVKLLERTSRRVVLTEPGKLLVDAEIKQGVLRALNITGVRLALSFNVIYHREKNSSPLIGAFIEVLKEHRPKLARYGT